ncbi:MAG: glutamate--tRNA ligase family protein [Candidatus Vogelbacteria bacterium]
MSVVVRFAPSPTGTLHVGSARTALFNYLFAKQNGGQIFLRIEDTDRERSKPEFEQNIFEGLDWLGLKFDNSEPIRQSERTAIYRAVLEKLISAGTAYVSKEEINDKNKRGEVIRLRNSGQKITFTDLIRGEISFDTTELGDFVIAKSFDEPLYHFAVVVDDWKMGITHIIRGEDHISNTPRQILIQEALDAPDGKAGASRPIYAHIPLILAPDRSKLSKRNLPDGKAGGAVSVTEYREQGFLPEALLNYLALLGWNPGTDQEIFSSLTELTKQFSLDKVQKGGAIFNLEKLKWLNREHLKLAGDSIWENIFLTDWPSDLRARVIPIIRERVATLTEGKSLITSGEYDYFRMAPIVDRTLLKTPATLAKTIALLDTLPETDFTAAQIKTALWSYAEEAGRGAVLWPLRMALTGKERSPDPFTVASILGKEETLSRLRKITNDVV